MTPRGGHSCLGQGWAGRSGLHSPAEGNPASVSPAQLEWSRSARAYFPLHIGGLSPPTDGPAGRRRKKEYVDVKNQTVCSWDQSNPRRAGAARCAHRQGQVRGAAAPAALQLRRLRRLRPAPRAERTASPAERPQERGFRAAGGQLESPAGWRQRWGPAPQPGNFLN